MEFVDLYPSDPEDIYRGEAIIQYLIDIRKKVFEWIMEQDRTKFLETRKKYYEETLPPMLKKLEAFICSNPAGTEFAVGKSLTMCDIYLVYFYSYDLYTIHKELAAPIWAQCNSLSRHCGS